MSSETRDTIFALLQRKNEALTAKDLARLMGASDVRTLKPVINRELYQMAREGLLQRTQDTPPKWKVCNHDEQAGQNDEEPPLSMPDDAIHVFIDVDNSPFLRQAAPYAQGDVYIWAYASPAYNHYQPAPRRHLMYEKLASDQDMASAADIKFCMCMTRLCLQAEHPEELLFLVVSKDKILHTMAKLHAAEYGANYVIIQDGWDGLREHLE